MNTNVNYLSFFKLWLQTQGYTMTTIRNYVADINKYVRFTDSGDIFASESLGKYITSITGQKNNHRYLTSLNKLFEFAQAQNLIFTNPFKKIKKQVCPASNFREITSCGLEYILDQYQEYLSQNHKNLFTIKNYLNDVQQFINWTRTPHVSKQVL